MKPLRIGVVGTGEWASRVHLPSISAHPDLVLSGVWGRNTDAAELLAVRHHSRPAASFDALLSVSDIIAFAVPPVAQPALAAQAARRGRHVILEKPIAEHAFEADFLAQTVKTSGVGAVVCLLRLFDPAHAAWLDRMRDRSWDRLDVHWFNDAMVAGSPFASDWRRTSGAVVDIAPHIICQAEHVFGPVEDAALHQEGRTTILRMTHAASKTTEAVIDLEFAEEPREQYVFSNASAAESLAADLDMGLAYTALLDQMVLHAPGHPQTGPAWDLHHAARAVDIVDALTTTGAWHTDLLASHEQAHA